MVEAPSSAKVWERAVPWSPDGAVVVGGSIIAVGLAIDGNPPSVVAVDVRTGAPRWQRFLASERLRVVATTSSTVIVQARERLIALDEATGAVRWDQELAEAAPVVPSPLLTADVSARSPDLAVFEAEGGFTAVRLSDGQRHDLGGGLLAMAHGDRAFVVSGSRVQAHSSAPGAPPLWESDLLPLDDVYSEPVRLMADDEAVVVVVGSDLGPDHRVVVLDSGSGEILWSDDGVRDAALVNSLLLIDRRSGSEPDGVTRQTIARDLRSGRELWMRSSSGSLGGYLGASPAGLAFGVGGGLGNGIEVVRLAASTGDGALPPGAPLLADEVGAGPTLVTDELVVVAWGDRHISAFDGGSESRRRWDLTTDLPMRSAALTSEGVLISVGDADYGCD